MCGFSGFLDMTASTGVTELGAVVTRMVDTLAHRGPDDRGVWLDAEAGIAMGHRRLSIVDLSPEGHQPMASFCGRYLLVFNGEVYNFRLICSELQKVDGSIVWRGHSDTEVLLAAVTHWGLQGALSRINGMFALALWDRKDRVLHLVRDRLGEKPLYYGRVGNLFLFGSELKALRAHPAFKAEINRDALTLLLRHNCIPAPYSIYKGIHKLTSGTMLSLSAVDGDQSNEIIPRPYWSLYDAIKIGRDAPFLGSDEEAVAELDSLLRDAVGLRMVADVPLGAFLSGGIDSSTVVALMQAQADRSVKTYSIGFENGDYNEAQYAKEVANHLGTDHTELYVTSEQALDVIPRLSSLYDEPFADSSQIPTFLVSQLARSQVTVALPGDGGDELFAGYNRHIFGPAIWRKIGWVPSGLRRIAAKAIGRISPKGWDDFFRQVGAVFPGGARQRNPGYKLHKLAEVLSASSQDEVYKTLVSHWHGPDAVVLGASEPVTILTEPDRWPDGLEFAESMMYLDSMTYLADDILTKVDRASMGVSLEARVPLLDHRIVEFAWRVPLAMKLRHGQGKWLLRQVLYQYVPRELIERPKAGFGIPLADWLRGPLRGWTENLLSERRLRDDGYFDPHLVRLKWVEHLSGKHNWAYLLWDVLMFQSWLETQKS